MKLCMASTPVNVTDASKHSAFYPFHHMAGLRTRVSELGWLPATYRPVYLIMSYTEPGHRNAFLVLGRQGHTGSKGRELATGGVLGLLGFQLDLLQLILTKRKRGRLFTLYSRF